MRYNAVDDIVDDSVENTVDTGWLTCVLIVEYYRIIICLDRAVNLEHGLQFKYEILRCNVYSQQPEILIIQNIQSGSK